MKYFLGIDAGTSGIKAMILDENGVISGIGYDECDVLTPHPGWAEQDPHMWWEVCQRAVKQAVKKSGHGMEIEGIGFSGQMQGSTLMDKEMQPLGNCMIWLVQRSEPEVRDIEKLLTD